MFTKKDSKPTVLARILVRLSPRRIGKAIYILFTEGPRALIKKSLEANYIDRDFDAFRKAAEFGLFLSSSPEYDSEAAGLVSEFSARGLELKSFDKKEKNGVSFLLFPESDEKPEGVYIVINKSAQRI